MTSPVSRSSALLLVAAFVAACASNPAATAESSARGITDPTAMIAQSQHGMVASASKLATEVGARVLAQGGNAVDAAAATAFALAVTEPNMSGLGGRASMLIRTPDGTVFGLDGLNKVPNSFRNGAPAGYGNAAIPGVPSTLVMAVQRYGTWSLADIMAPAIELAERGFPLTAPTAAFIEAAAADLRQHPSSRAIFLKPDGSPYSAGDTLVQKDLARTLRGIAEGGARAFYHGWIADSISNDMRKMGGFITREELAGYTAIPAIVVRGKYRGNEIISNYDPASGHTVVQALQMLEQFDMSRLKGAEYGSIVGQAMQLALADRSRRFGTPLQSALQLTSRAWATERAKLIGVPGPPRAAARDTSGTWWLRPDQDNTTHLSVVDGNRMVVALTQSLGPSMGTRLAAPGLGFLYATRLGTTPGSRPGSTIAPTIVLDSVGQPRMVLGAAGDARIITAVIQTISRAIDAGLSLDRAVAAPRVHPQGAASLAVERGTDIRWSDAELERFRALGFQVDTMPSTFFARVHAVAIDHRRARLLGVAEPRGNGGTSGPLGAPVKR